MKKKTSTSRHRSKAQLLVEAAAKRVKTLFAQERYAESLAVCQQLMRTYPEVSGSWSDGAACCIQLERWQDAIRYAQAALARGEKDNLAIYDALSNASGQLKQWDDVRRYGLQALNMRAQRFGGEPLIPLPASGPMPPPPSAQTRERNVIAFSLFGGNSKYCEPAVLNVQEQPKIYPHWVCRFYVDDSVPEHVISRLRAGGGQIVPVEGAALQWPGPMWRFLALGDALAHRVLFRDADSLISPREAAAVDQWLSSGKRFHMMRDDSSHTELILAGLWGVVGGSLPPLEQLMQRFMSAPLASRHFADQYFLRQYVWPYARASLMQHDSMFDFMDAAPFPTPKGADEPNVGYREGLPFFTLKSNLPNGSSVTWALHLIEPGDDGKTREELVCAYPGAVKDGAVTAHIPARYARRLEQGTAGVRVVVADKAA
ncbi:MAG: hypothetical protein LBU72_06410 [Burkholderiaceae bacterium]|jgi:hypothetical protein|nr:hypothetical protein [Burkholderiaceae bacterium]